MSTTLPPPPVPGQAPPGRARPLAALLLCLAGTLPWAAPAGAESISGGIYTVLFAPGRERTARFVLDLAAGAMGDLERDLGGRYGREVTIVILDRERGGATAPPEGMPSWFAGAALPEEGTIWLKTSSALEQGPADLPRTLTHELAHLYLRWRTGGRRLPLWLEEGLAMRQSGDYGLGDRIELMGAAALGNLMPLSAIEDSFPREEGRARVAYAAGASFLAWLDRLGGEGSVSRLLDAIASGAGFETAFRRVYGRRPDTAEVEWRRSLTRWSRWLAAAAGGTSLWGLISLLFLFSYWMKKYKSQRLLEVMDEEEEKVYEPPGEEDLPSRRLGPGRGIWPGRRGGVH